MVLILLLTSEEWRENSEITFHAVYIPLIHTHTHPTQRHSERALLQTSPEMPCEQMCERRKGGRFFMHHRSSSRDRANDACRYKRTSGRATFSPSCLDASSKWARRVARPHSSKWHVSIRLTPSNVKVAEITEHVEDVGKLLHRQLLRRTLVVTLVLGCTKAASQCAAAVGPASPCQNLLAQIDFSAYSGLRKHLRAAGRVIFLSIMAETPRMFLFVDEHLVESCLIRNLVQLSNVFLEWTRELLTFLMAVISTVTMSASRTNMSYWRDRNWMHLSAY